MVSSNFGQTPLRVFEHRLHLAARDTGKPFQKFGHGCTAFEILEQRLHGHACACEKPNAGNLAGNPLHRRALGPIEHARIKTGSVPLGKPAARIAIARFA